MTDLFSEQPLTPPVLEENKNYYEEIVGEGKKFKSNEDLARGKIQSDSYIKILEKRLDQAREEYTKTLEDNKARAQLSDLIDQLKGTKLPQSTEPPKDVKQPDIFDERKLEEMFESKLARHELAKKQQSNADFIQSKLKERYGANYATVLQNQMDELGMSKDEINALAKNNPQLLIKAMGLDQPVQKDPFNNPPPNQMRGEFKPTGAKARTWSYYQTLKEKDPQAYLQPQIAIQMQQDAIEQGDTFYDGDFNADVEQKLYRR